MGRADEAGAAQQALGRARDAQGEAGLDERHGAVGLATRGRAQRGEHDAVPAGDVGGVARGEFDHRVVGLHALGGQREPDGRLGQVSVVHIGGRGRGQQGLGLERRERRAGRFGQHAQGDGAVAVGHVLITPEHQRDHRHERDDERDHIVGHQAQQALEQILQAGGRMAAWRQGRL